jgi:hypothetical protein
VVSTNGLEEGRFQQVFVFVFVEEVQRRQQQEVVEKEVSIITGLFWGVVLKGRRKPALRFDAASAASS